MEDARKASLWSQQLDARCRLLCNQSAEGTKKMQLDVNRCLELRIKEEDFWIAELQGRKATVQKVIDDARALERRLDHAVLVVDKLSAANQECIKQRIIFGMDVINEHLHEESRMLRNINDAIDNMDIKTMEIQAQLLATCRALEEDTASKYAAMETDKRSLDLSTKRIHHISFGSAGQIEKVEDANHWKSVPSDVLLKTADEQIRVCELHLEKSDAFLRTTAESVASEAAKVTQVIREHNRGLQNEKDDLQIHLDMTNVHIEETNETVHRLSKAIANKENAISVALYRLDLHRARPPSELHQVDKDIWIVLERELAASRAELEDLLDQVPALEASQRALRRSQLQIGKDIKEKIQLVEVEELKCLAVRDAQMTSINL